MCAETSIFFFRAGYRSRRDPVPQLIDLLLDQQRADEAAEALDTLLQVHPHLAEDPDVLPGPPPPFFSSESNQWKCSLVCCEMKKNQKCVKRQIGSVGPTCVDFGKDARGDGIPPIICKIQVVSQSHQVENVGPSNVPCAGFTNPFPKEPLLLILDRRKETLFPLCGWGIAHVVF